MAVAQFDDFDEDPYRTKVLKDFNPNSGIAGPQDLPPPVAAPPGGYDLEGFRKRWTQSGDVNDPNAWLQGNQDITQGVTLRNEKAYDPSGRFIADLVGNYSGGDPSKRSRIFLDGVGGNRSRTSNRSASSSSMTSAAPPAANPFLTQIRQLIMERLGKMSQDPSLDDPALASQSTAYRRSRERGAQQERAAMAERAAANGLIQGGQSSGGFDTDLRSITEGASEDIAGNDASLLGRESDARRNEVQSLLNMALQSGDAESARMLQMELARMDEALRLQAMENQNSQYYSGLNQQGSQWDDQFGRNLNRDYEDDYRWRVNQGLGV